MATLATMEATILSTLVLTTLNGSVWCAYRRADPDRQARIDVEMFVINGRGLPSGQLRTPLSRILGNR